MERIEVYSLRNTDYNHVLATDLQLEQDLDAVSASRRRRWVSVLKSGFYLDAKQQSPTMSCRVILPPHILRMKLTTPTDKMLSTESGVVS